MDERRKHPRFPVDLQCWCDSGGSTAYIPMKNLGQDGVFLKTALPFPAGRRAHLGWLLPGDVQVQADAEVVWATNSGSATMDPGMGLRFIDIIEGDDILRIYLKKRRLVGE